MIFLMLFWRMLSIRQSKICFDLPYKQFEERVPESIKVGNLKRNKHCLYNETGGCPNAFKINQIKLRFKIQVVIVNKAKCKIKRISYVAQPRAPCRLRQDSRYW